MSKWLLTNLPFLKFVDVTVLNGMRAEKSLEDVSCFLKKRGRADKIAVYGLYAQRQSIAGKKKTLIIFCGIGADSDVTRGMMLSEHLAQPDDLLDEQQGQDRFVVINRRHGHYY